MNVAPTPRLTEHLLCPRCGTSPLSRSSASLTCAGCSAEYAVNNGVPILLKDTAARTQLEDIDYDSLHEVTEEGSRRLFSSWAKVLDSLSAGNNHVLEIGSGTGNLSRGLIGSGRFSHCHISDISEKFISIQRQRNPKGNDPVSYYVCDANYLPFRNSFFDAVLGNSVLHHFLDFDRTLAQCYSILSEKGVAVFAEPVREGHVHIAFLNALMHELDTRYGLGVFTADDHARLQQMSRHVTKHRRVGQNRDELAKLEDKHIFSIAQLKELGRQIGFRSVQFFSMSGEPGGGAERGYRSHHHSIMKRHGIAIEKIREFDFLFDIFGRTVSDALESHVVAPFGYFVFEK